MEKRILKNAQPFEMGNGEHGVLLIHGFTGSPAHMRLIGEDLAAAGFYVKAILLPGHGTRPEDMKKVTWQDWLLSVRQAAKEMQEKCRYFSVAGLSMGGVLSLILAQERDVTACIPIAAPIRIFNPFRRLALLASPFVPMMGKGEGRKLIHPEYDVGYDTNPTKSVHDLSVLMDKARRDLALIHSPVLCIQSMKDKTVRPESVDIILEGVSSREKGKLWLENSPHVCTIAGERDKISKAMIAFLRKAEQTELTKNVRV